MDRSWLTIPRQLVAYTDAINKFLDQAIANGVGPDKFRCPCKKCCNRYSFERKIIVEHLVWHDMDKDYKKAWWQYHGEPNIEDSNVTNIKDEIGLLVAHSRKSKSRIDGPSQDRGGSMENLVQSQVDAGMEDCPELRTQIYNDNKGLDTRKRVLGYEHEVTPVIFPYAKLTASSSFKRTSRTREAILEAENLDLKRKYEVVLAQLDAQGKTLDKLRTQQQQHHQMMMMMMGMTMQSMQPQTHAQSSQPHPQGSHPPHLMYPMYQMSYKSPSPFQMPGYRPEVPIHHSSGNFHHYIGGAPYGEFGTLLSGVGPIVEMTKPFVSRGTLGSTAGSGSHSA